VRKPASISGRPIFKTEHEIVSELDSEMNGFLESLPPHCSFKCVSCYELSLTYLSVQWDPNNPDDFFFHQSAILHISYYHVQIFIHKPFMPIPGIPATIAYPSLTICVNAARSCAHYARMKCARPSGPQIAEGHFHVRAFNLTNHSFSTTHIPRLPSLLQLLFFY
jgi:hypothetical protein